MSDDQIRAADGGPESNSSADADLFRTLITQLAADPRIVFPPTTPHDASRASIVDSALADPVQRRELLAAVFPNQSCPPAIFFEKLGTIIRFLGFGEPATNAAGRVWLEILKSADTPTCEEILTAFPKTNGTDYWFLAGSLQVVLREYELGAEFALRFFTVMFKRVASEGGAGAVYLAVQGFCENFPSVALKGLGFIYNDLQNDYRHLAQFMLGALRKGTLTRPQRTAYTRISNGFRDSAAQAMKAVYYQSCVTTALMHGLSDLEVKKFLARAGSGPHASTNDIICATCQIAMAEKTPLTARSTALTWLRNCANRSISAQAKLSVAHMAATAAFAKRGGVSNSAGDLGDLVFAIQPIAVDDGPTWQEVEQWLMNVLRSDAPAFGRHFVAFAERDPDGLHAVIRDRQGFGSLENEMRVNGVVDPVASLIVSADSRCRRLGLYLFDTLPVETVPQAVLDGAGELRVKLAFHELRRAHPRGEAIARLLVSLLPCVAAMDAEFQNEFFAELLYQGRNYPGVFRQELTKRAGDVSMVKKALQVLENYFESLHAAQTSGVAAMQVPGYHRARRLFVRGFSRGISDGTKRGSVLLSLFKTVQLLYGSTAGSYFDEQLTEPSPLQHFSHGTELPTIAFSDPEGRMLRHQQITWQMQSLTETEPLDKTAVGS